MEQFLKYCPAKIFGVTGSDGKTTTTTLIANMLSEQGHKVFIGGNIGNPLFNIIEDIRADDFAVVELSSFQLMECMYSPEIAVITNLSPNHLDIHKDMEEYINSKKNIFLNQDSNSFLVLNLDNDITCSLQKESISDKRMFSIKNKAAFAHLEGESLVVNDRKVCETSDVIIPGMHNIENLLAAFCAVDDYVSIESMKKVAITFTGVEHRIEFVKSVDGVRYYNDSIASSPTRTVAGLNSFKQKVILIAGGYDKKIPFDELAIGGIDKVKILIVMGNTKEKIKTAFENEMIKRNIKIDVIEAESLEDAVLKAKKVSVQGDIVTMSPACASFDMFKNFEIRGRKFKEIVNKL
jgi:UDP-N-acetylmuramoylalanine--D-glutamate ligase